MTIGSWTHAAALLGSASIASTMIYAATRVAVTGLQSMSRPGLQFRERLLVGLLSFGYIVILLVTGTLLTYRPACRSPVSQMNGDSSLEMCRDIRAQAETRLWR
jgi:hypothetical protein